MHVIGKVLLPQKKDPIIYSDCSSLKDMAWGLL